MPRWYILHKTSYRRFCLCFGRGRIWLTSFNSPFTNTTYWAQAAPQYFLYEQSLSVVVKFDWHHLITCPGEPTGRRKHLGDISYRRRVISDFALNFVAMATGLVEVEFVRHHSIAHPRIPPTRHKWHRDIFYTSGVCFLSVLSQFSLPWQPGSVVVKFDWHHLITCPGNSLV